MMVSIYNDYIINKVQYYNLLINKLSVRTQNYKLPNKSYSIIDLLNEIYKTISVSDETSYNLYKKYKFVKKISKIIDQFI